VQSEEDEFARQQLMKDGLNDSIFVLWYGIKGMLDGIGEWEMSPGNVDGIFQKTILPQLRKQKDATWLNYWDDKIQSEASRASKSPLMLVNETFNQRRKPSLQWARALDMALLGQKNRAAAEMFAIIKNNPSHPDASHWIEQLEKFLDPAAASPPAVAP
jgi:hypothetical protein